MKTKLCSMCRQVKPITEFYTHKGKGYQANCKSCNRIYARTYSQTPKRQAYNKQLYERLQAEGYFRDYQKRPAVRRRVAKQKEQYRKRPEVRIKNLARWYTNHQIRAGKVSREPCALCGLEQGEAHHLDYSQPLLIVWLCPSCHRQAHLKQSLEDKK